MADKDKKTIEEKILLEHILLHPDLYIGSVEKNTQTMWIYEKEEMVQRPSTYVPGLYKIFDEILVNAADNKQRDPFLDSLKVDIDTEANCISVYNNGKGVPIKIHQGEGVYLPEMIFGHLLTSSSYDYKVKKTTSGTNGYGAKLTNIFSTEFIIETADAKRRKKYKQVFTGNMWNKSQPSITKCKEGENWTKVIFKPDLLKFNMSHLEEDVVAMMKKRVVDLAGTLGKTVKVDLDGKRISVETFTDYVNLYLESASKSRIEPLPRVFEKVNDRWEISVSLSDGQFQQVSFVNSIHTIKGGTHVEYVTNQIVSNMMSIVNKRNGNANLKPKNVKNHLWVFVNCLIDDPIFDSCTKEALTTRQENFGSKCKISHDFLRKVAKSRIMEILLSGFFFKKNEELKKIGGIKRQRIIDISELYDAKYAGGNYSDKCTLILTKGNSSMALITDCISVVGWDYYGVFSVRRKLLNVRKANHNQIMKNADIQNIKEILGLQQGKHYDTVKGLRYGHLMIMTDQDQDGSHFKGLLINFIHSFWPSLLKIPSFLVECITPIVKATYNKIDKDMSFYTMHEYESWKESLGVNASDWSIKLYKKLGTISSKEGMEYFQNLDKHKKYFIWCDEQDGDAIELAFSKKKIQARRNWLWQFEPGTYLDQNESFIRYSDFINKELILFFIEDLRQSIPSMVDGLKPGQRKILFCSFKSNFVKEAQILHLFGYVYAHSAYDHDGQVLIHTIIRMAQDFVGSNNINLLQPINNLIGTRRQGGKVKAIARKIYAKLSPITRFLFPKDDDLYLDYLSEKGQSIEPKWYVPIIPMVLVNGSKGICNNWSSYIPNYNPKDIVKNLRHLLNDEPMVTMIPWYKGFKGLIEKTTTKKVGATYTTTGIIEETNSTTLTITELPIGRWTEDYKKFLKSLMIRTDKIKEPFIKDYKDYSDCLIVYFEVILPEQNLILAKQGGLEEKFKLITTIHTSSMYLLDHNGIIKKYDTPEQILEEFFHLRIIYYEKRMKTSLDKLELDLLKLNNKSRFILDVVSGRIIVTNRLRGEFLLELQEKSFTYFPKNTTRNYLVITGVKVEAEESEIAEVLKGGVPTDYDYLLSMAIGSLTWEKTQEFFTEKEKLEKELEELRGSRPSSLWKKDLDALEKELNELERQAIIVDEEEREKIKARRKNAKSSAAVEPIAIDSETAHEANKPKLIGRRKRSTAKHVSVAKARPREENTEQDICVQIKRMRRG